MTTPEKTGSVAYHRPRPNYLLSVLALVVSTVVFLVPFAFIALTAVKDTAQSAELNFSWPAQFQFMQNFLDVVKARDYMLIIAFFNSAVLTVISVTIMVVFAAMAAFVLQRTTSRWNGVINFLVLSGLIIPPAVVPTIWVLRGLGLFRTMPGLIAIEIAFGLAFCVMLFRGFISTIPQALDEAAAMDGAGPLRLFFQGILPLLRPVVVTAIIAQSIVVFNDFSNPLYFLPEAQYPTVQLTLYNFYGQYGAEYNLLFMNILLITIPPLLMFLFFNRQIVEGMTAGGVRG